jgi:hypothetical protein
MRVSYHRREARQALATLILRARRSVVSRP